MRSVHFQFLALAGLLFMAASGSAQILEGFHIFEGVIDAGHGLQVTPQARLRTTDRFREISQVRAGLIFAQTVHPHLDLIAAGYYEPTVKQPEFLRSYRVQLGGQARFKVAEHLELQPRVMWERLNRTTGLAYRRDRMALRLTWRRTGMSPYVYNETMLTGDGPSGLFHSSRMGGGVGFAASKRARLEFEYFYDVRRAFWGGDRQVVTTRIQFR